MPHIALYAPDSLNGAGVGNIKQGTLGSVTEAERREMAVRWRAKLARAEAGQQRWLLITARAP